MHEFEAAIFDVGGVLHKNIVQHVRKDIAAHFGLQKDEFRDAWRKTSLPLGTGEINEAEFWQRFIARIQSTIPLPEESLLVREYARRFKANRGVLNIIDQLDLESYKLAIPSNTVEAHVKFLSERGLFDKFDIKVFSNEVGLHKPDPEIYLVTLEQLGTNADRAFFVDDNANNVMAANNMGIRGIQYISTKQLRRDLKSLSVL